MSSKKKIVLTGSSGRLGRAIHRSLCERFKIIGLDTSPSSATSVIASISDTEALHRTFLGAEVVIHTAALHAPHVGLAEDAEFWRTNVEATEAIVKVAKACGVSRLVFTSTTALYGVGKNHQGAALWIDEETEPRPRSIYHETKLKAEEIVQAHAGDGLTARVLRVSRCFPEPAPFMAVFRLHRGVDARDVGQAHALAALDDGEPFARYIISGDTPFQRSDCEELGSEAKKLIRARCPDLAQAFKGRGWSLPSSIDRVYLLLSTGENGAGLEAAVRLSSCSRHVGRRQCRGPACAYNRGLGFCY